jgi:hypothetical protein
MTKVVFTACLLVVAVFMATSRALARDPTQLFLHKSGRVGVINMMDPEVTHYQAGKLLPQSFLKTHPVGWQIESMLVDAVGPRIAKLELVAVPLAASDALMHAREESFIENSVAKGLPRDVSKDIAQIAAAEHLDAVIILAPGLNNSAQAGSAVRKALPDFLRGWGFVTGYGFETPSLFNMTQVLLVGVSSEGVVLNAREWGGAYTGEWPDYVANENPKEVSGDQLDRAQPLFEKLLTRQADRVMDYITVTP